MKSSKSSFLYPFNELFILVTHLSFVLTTVYVIVNVKAISRYYTVFFGLKDFSISLVIESRRRIFVGVQRNKILCSTYTITSEGCCQNSITVREAVLQFEIFIVNMPWTENFDSYTNTPVNIIKDVKWFLGEWRERG